MQRAWELMRRGVKCRRRHGFDPSLPMAALLVLSMFSAATGGEYFAGHSMSNVTDLVRALGASNAGLQADAAQKLAQLGEDARPAAVALVRAVATDDENLREWTVSALEGLGTPDAGDVPQLTELLKRPELDVAYWAATLLGRLERQGASAVPALTQALSNHSEMAVRQRAAWALGQIGQGASAAKDALTQAAKSPDPRLAKLAKAALDRI